jgi:hypothetical protein
VTVEIELACQTAEQELHEAKNRKWIRQHGEPRAPFLQLSDFLGDLANPLFLLRPAGLMKRFVRLDQAIRREVQFLDGSNQKTLLGAEGEHVVALTTAKLRLSRNSFFDSPSARFPSMPGRPLYRT